MSHEVAQADQPEPLSTDAVVDAAMAVVARESFDALSMRKVARELGRAPMSLYRHVQDVEALRLLVAEALVGRMAITDHGADWRRTLADGARALRTVVGADPGILTVLMRSGMTSPNMLAALDVLIGALRRAGLDPADAARAQAALVAMVFGSVVVERAAQDVFGDSTRTGGLQRMVDRLLDAGGAAHANIAAVAPAWMAMEDDEPFTFALARLLDGIARTAER